MYSNYENGSNQTNYYREFNDFNIKRSNKNKLIILIIFIIIILNFFLIYKNLRKEEDLFLKELSVVVGDEIDTDLISSNVNADYIWSSSNEDVIIITDEGDFIAVGEGSAVIKAEKDGKLYECEVIVTDVKNAIQTESVSLEKKEITLNLGEKEKLLYTIEPKNISSDIVNWYSSNENVIVIENGVVISKKVGTAIITIATWDGKTDICNVKVVNNDLSSNENVSENEIVAPEIDNIVEVESIRFNSNEITINTGEIYNLTYEIFPKNANTTIIWSSSNNKVISISGDGTLLARDKGASTITATTLNGKKASITINVIVPIIDVKSLVLNKTSANIVVGDFVKLSAIVEPLNATNKNIVWSSSNTSIATVDDIGNVNALKEGVATIIAKTNNGKIAKAMINVVNKKIDVETITIDNTISKINVGETLQLKEKYSPLNATNTEIKWESSDNTIATVSNNGLVTAKKNGIVTISAETLNGKKANITITVIQPVQSISLNKTVLSLNVGETYNLVATIYPVNANDKNIIWTSSNNSIVEVDQKGLIKALKEGNVIINAKTSNGKLVTSSIGVTKVLLNNITLDTEDRTMAIGDVWKINAILNPSNVSDKKIIWKTDNPSVATVNSDGLVTAVGGGISTITAISNGKSVNMKVTVKNYNLIVDNGNFLKVSGQNIVKSISNLKITLKGFNLGVYLSRSSAFMPIEPYASSQEELEKKGYSCINSEAFIQALEKNPNIIKRSQEVGRSSNLIANDLSYILYDNYITEQDFDLIAQSGANVIRLPFEFGLFLYQNPINALYSYSDTRAKVAFERIDWVIEQCKKRGIYVIIDLHLAPGRQNSGGWCGEHLFFYGVNSANYQNAVKVMWGKIAARYKDEETVAGYDLLNEPEASVSKLVEFYDNVYHEIRKYDKNHIIIMEETCVYCGETTKGNSNNYNLVGNLPCPSTKGWSNVVYSTHDYLYDRVNGEINYSTSPDKIKQRVETKVYNTKLKSNICSVPYYIGEFSHLGSYSSGSSNYKNYLSVWKDAMTLYDSSNLSYTPWTYKGSHDRYFGLVFYSSLVKADIENDTYEEIKSVFSKNSAQAMRFNKEYYEMFVEQWGGRLTTDIKFIDTFVVLNVGDEYTINYEITPKTAIRKKVNWTTDDLSGKVIKIDKATGKIIAVGKGKATVTATVTPLILVSDSKNAINTIQIEVK